MGISEEKMKIVINNYFKSECDVDTSIREAFEKGFRIGVKKGLAQSKADTPQTMTKHDLAVALAKQLEEEGITDEELERLIHDAEEEARKEIARMKGVDDYERAIEQMEHDMLYEPTYNSEDGSM